MRAAIFALPRAISAATKEWLTFQSEMSRVATVTRTTAEGFQFLEKAIVDSASRSKTSFKDTASVVYALGSAGLTAQQQLAGFNHVIDLSVGTGGNLEQTAKLVAGAVNVFGKSLKDATTAGEKFKRVSDVIAYTYSTQQVELAELATAMGYVASVGSLVDIKFEELVATIGVLNTGMLKGSKSGTSLVNAFIQLARKSDRLGALGIEVDTSKPLNFLEVMRDLNDVVQGGKLSLDKLSVIMRSFGIRGGRAVGLLLNNFVAFEKVLKNTLDGDVITDFAEIMRRMAEDNIPAQAKKIRDSFTGIWMGVLDEVEEPWMNFLKNIFDNLEEFRARQQMLKDSGRGDESLGQRLQKSVPAAGVGVGAFMIGRGLTGRVGLHPQIEARAAQMAQGAAERIPQVAEKVGVQNLTPRGQQIIAQGGASAKMFRPDALKEFSQQNGKMATGLMHLGGTLQNVAKGAVLAYGAMKLVQGILHQVADPHTAEQWDKVVGVIETGIATAFKGIVWLFEFLGIFFGNLTTEILGAFDNIKKGVMSFVETMAALIDPLIAMVQLRRGEISGAEGISRMKFGKFRELQDERKEDKVKEDRLNSLLELNKGEEKEKTWSEKNSVGKAIKEVEQFRKEDKGQSERDKAETKFNQSMTGFFNQMGLAGASKDLSKLDSVKAEIAEARALAMTQSHGMIAFQETLTQLFKDKESGKIDANQYTIGIIKTQAAMEDRIDELAKQNKISDPAKTKAKLGATGMSALYDDGKGVGTQAFKVQQALKGSLFIGASAEQLAEKGEGTDSATLLRQFDADIAAVIAKNQTASLGMFGISESVIAMQELEIEFNKFMAVKDDAVGLSKEELSVSDLLVDNSEKLRNIVEHNSALQEDIVKLQEKGLAVVRKQQEVILKLGSGVRDAFKDSFKDSLGGFLRGEDISFQAIAGKFGDAIKDQWVNNLGDILGDVVANVTGMDAMFGSIFKGLGDAFRGLTSPIAKAHLDGITAGAKIIINAHKDGMAEGEEDTISSVTGGSGKGGIGGAIGGVLSKILGTKAVKNFLTTPIGSSGGYTKAAPKTRTYSRYAQRLTYTNAAGGYGYGSDAASQNNSFYAQLDASRAEGQSSSLDGGNLTQYQNQPGGTTKRGGGVPGLTGGAVVGGVISGYAEGSSVMERGGSMGQAIGAGAGSAMAGIGGAVLASALGGWTALGGTATLMTAMGPWGWVGLAALVVGMVMMNMFQPEPDTQRSEQVREQTTQLASRIDITNSSLDWVNRNLVELRQELTYIMRESFYFSERSEAERFAVDSRRGVLGG